MDENCIFCKIIKGEIPAKKVYEDDIMIAILDIHPAAKGHVLVIPKEHQPILPLISFEQQQHLFKKTQGIAQAIKEAVLCNNISIFVANGGAAGQQSPHFLYHIIPREEGDMLETLHLPNKGNVEENDSLVSQTSQKIGMMMQAYLQETGRQEPIQTTEKQEEIKAEEETPLETKETNNEANDNNLDALIKTINENEDLKEALMFRPEEVKEAVARIPKWQALFAGVNIDELSTNLKVLYAANKKEAEENKKNETKEYKDTQPSIPRQADLDKISKLL